MTSNLGSDEFRKFTKPLGFLPEGQALGDLKKTIMKEVENTFSPEFLNRIDDIIIFSPLTRDEVKKIAAIYLNNLTRHMEENGKILEVSDAALDILVNTGYSPKYGARFLKRTIDEKVKVPITLQWKTGARFHVEAVGDEIGVECGAQELAGV
jgi:ATP-dependent Clp protease ATP-binding subunit ClpA